MTRLFTLSVACLLSGSLWSQIQLSEATVGGSQFMAGYSKADSLDRDRAAGKDLGYVLSRQGWNVLAGGAPGQQRGLRNFGFSGDHTTLWWNGLELNSLTLGTADLSLLPAFLFPATESSLTPEVTYVPGTSLAGAAILKTSGFKDGRFTSDISANSMKNAAIGLRFTRRFKKWNSSSAFYLSEDKNVFSYIDGLKPGLPNVEQFHNDQQQIHILQTLSRSLGKLGTASVSAWWTTRQLNIPRTEGSYGFGNTRQHEQSLRLSSALTWQRGKTRFNFGTGHAIESFVYEQLPCAKCEWQTLSDIPSQRHVIQGGVRFCLDSNSPWLEVNLRHVISSVNSIVHGGQIIQHDPQLRLTLPFKKHWVFAASQIFRPGLLPESSLSYRRQIDKGSFRVQASHLSRQPDFNERYWIPGGNSDLLPEHGWSLMASLRKQWKGWTFSGEVGASALQDAIQWIYNSDLAYWTPENVGFSRQTRASLAADFAIGSFGLTGRLNWLNSLQIVDQDWLEKANGIQNWRASAPVEISTYTPQWSGHLRLSYRAGLTLIHAEGLGSSSRRTNINENAKELPAYVILNVGAIRPIGKALKLRFSMDNILNHSYQMISGYPLPGRVLNIGIQFNHDFKKQ